MASVKPLDSDAIVAAARENRGIVTVEEGMATGGLGGAVAELVTRTVPTRVMQLGFHDFAPVGPTTYLFSDAGLDPESIAAAAASLAGGSDAA